MGMKFDKGPLAVEQNKYTTKVVNVCIVYDLDAWSRNPTNKFKFRNCLLGATNIVENRDKEKYVYRGFGITFDSSDSWNFDNDTGRNIITFGIDNNSIHQGPSFGINESFDSPEIKLCINFSKTNTKLCLRLHYNADKNYMFVNEIEIFQFKADNKNVNSPTQF